MITHENAMRCFSFDPFARRPREQSTVAALRAEAADVDVSIKSMGRRKADASAMQTCSRWLPTARDFVA